MLVPSRAISSFPSRALSAAALASFAISEASAAVLCMVVWNSRVFSLSSWLAAACVEMLSRIRVVPSAKRVPLARSVCTVSCICVTVLRMRFCRSRRCEKARARSPISSGRFAMKAGRVTSLSPSTKRTTKLRILAIIRVRRVKTMMTVIMTTRKKRTPNIQDCQRTCASGTTRSSSGITAIVVYA